MIRIPDGGDRKNLEILSVLFRDLLGEELTNACMRAEVRCAPDGGYELRVTFDWYGVLSIIAERMK